MWKSTEDIHHIASQRHASLGARLLRVKVPPITERDWSQRIPQGEQAWPTEATSQLPEDTFASLGILLWTWCQYLNAKGMPRPDAGIMPTSQRNLCSLCHSLADCKWLARSSALPYLALLSPALLVEIPGGEWSVSTHFIFYSGATDQRRFVFVGPRRKKFAPQQGKAPAVHRNAYSEALSRG